MSFLPPLGALSRVPCTSTKLYFSVGSPTASPELWTNLPHGEWHSIAFIKDGTGLHIAQAQLEGQQGTFEYTYRYRNEDGSYTWLGQEGSNGRVELVPEVAPRIVGVDARVIKVDVPAGSMGELHDFDLLGLMNLDIEWEDSEGITLEQREPTWFVPRRIPPSSDPLSRLSSSSPAQYVFLRFPKSSAILFLLPLSTPDVSSYLLKIGGKAHLRCSRDQTGSLARGSLIIGLAPQGELKALVKACVAKASSVLAPISSLTATNVSSSSQTLKGLTWCTWNALGPNYTLSQVLASIEKIKKSTSKLYGWAVDSVLLDDGWQDTTSRATDEKGSRRLKSFGVRSGWYGLKEQHVAEGLEMNIAVQQIKGRGIKRVGVWLTLAGYWDGIDPTSSLAPMYKLGRFTLHSPLHPSNNGMWHLPTTRSGLRAFYSDYLATLKSAGVDFVKIDDQAHVDYLVSCEDPSVDVGALRTAMFDEMRSAAHTTFGIGNVTHCMAHSPRVFGSALTLVPNRTGARDILRNSDDYFPCVDDSHARHVYYNAITSILTSEFVGVDPDFDMCEQSHDWGEFHISWRSLQVAPVLSTDKGGDVKKGESWDRILARTKNGQAKVVQGHKTGSVLESRSTEDVLASGSGTALMAGVADRDGSARLGLWNCRAGGADSRTVIDAKDVVEAFGDEPLIADTYVVFVHSNGRATTETASDLRAAKGTPRLTARPLLDIALGPREDEGISIAPVYHFASANASLACLGLLGKFSGPAALTSVTFGPPTPSVILKTFPPRMPPKADGRLALLLASFFPLFLRSQVIFPSTTNSRRTTARLLLSDVWRQPAHTIWREISTFLAFTLGAVMWTLSLQLNERRRGSHLLRDAPTNGTLNGDAKEKKEVLRVETPFSGRLGFHLQEGDVDSVVVKVDGVELSKNAFKSVINDSRLFEVDLEAVQTSGVVPANDNDNWVVEISFA